MSKQEYRHYFLRNITYSGHLIGRENEIYDLILLFDVFDYVENQRDFIDSVLDKLTDIGKLLVNFGPLFQAEQETILASCHCAEFKLVQNSTFWILEK